MSKTQHKPLANVGQQEPTYRYRGRVSPSNIERQPIRAEVSTAKDGSVPVIRIYDVIDPWGGPWGISAKEVVDALDEIGDADSIQLRINSPGGDAFEGIAIYNALVNCPARIDVFVDSLAASAASVIAMAGDSITMALGSQMMIHEASTIAFGSADDLRTTAAMLDRMSDNIASVYADHTSTKPGVWREAMKAETWYSPQEAVEAGLATAVAKKSETKDSPKNDFDLSVFAYAGRADAPAPILNLDDTKNGDVRASVPDSSNHVQGKDRMTPQQLQAIGLPEDATEEQIDARLAELVANKVEAPAETEPETEPEIEAKPPVVEEPATEQPVPSLPENVVPVDKQILADMQNRLGNAERELENRRVAEASAERESILNTAVKEGKIKPADRAVYEDLLKDSPAKTKALLEAMPSNKIPVEEIGHGSDVEFNPTDELGYPTTYLTRNEKAAIATQYAGGNF